jgi:N-acetylneuraminic acid mutarotase
MINHKIVNTENCYSNAATFLGNLVFLISGNLQPGRREKKKHQQKLIKITFYWQNVKLVFPV